MVRQISQITNFYRIRAFDGTAFDRRALKAQVICKNFFERSKLKELKEFMPFKKDHKIMN